MLKISKRAGLTILVFFILFSASSQTKSELEQKKRNNQKRIQEIESILKETESSKKTSVGQLRALNMQISAREELISSIDKEIKYLDGEIRQINIVINALENDLITLREEYAALIYAAHKSSGSQDRLTFLFSSKSFNQFIMRLEYLEQYAKARKTQVEQINLVKDALGSQKVQIEQTQAEQKTLRQENLAESKRLASLKSKQNNVIASLNKKEKQLKKELAEQKIANERLETLIADLVARESRATASSTNFALTPEGKLLSSSFAENRKKLLWPVERGFISQKYGRQPHPALKGIYVDNPGIDIQTQGGATVRAVFDGKVSAIASVKGMPGVVVIIQHGEYRTVYANLKQATVKSGQLVKAKEQIGVVYTDGEGLSEVQFQVWKGGQRLNPQTWLYSN